MTVGLFKNSKKSTSRLNNYNPLEKLANPELVGSINNDSSYDLGTASLNRKENIYLVGSNSNKESISVSFKWRPIDESGYVSLVSKIELELGDGIYEHEQIVTYKPTSSNVRLERILQYGSPKSNLKFIIAAPYRRMRVIFCGNMRNKEPSSGETKFIKGNFIVSPTGGIFDFKHEFNKNYMSKQYTEAKLNCGLKKYIDLVILEDRHEQIVQIQGELLIGGGNERLKRNFYAWGFHARQFLDGKSGLIRTKRVMAHCLNGRAFHIAQNTCDKLKINYGYTCFEFKPPTKPVKQVQTLDWDKLNDQTNEFEVEVLGQGHRSKCVAGRRSEYSQFFDVLMNGKKGWAWLSIDNAIDSTQELDLIKQSQADLQMALKQNQIVVNPILDLSSKPLIVELLDAICSCSDLVGAKASSLAQLNTFSDQQDADYIVPYAFVLTRYAHDCILDHNDALKKEINQLEQSIGSGDLSYLRQDCERLQKLIEKAVFPENLRAELVTRVSGKYENLDEVTFAVRSSSWGEDEEDMSAAGQLSTVLGVRGIESLEKAVLTCLASKFSYANVEYKRLHGMAPTLPMAIVVQEMVECEKAGVLFTCEPTSGDDSLLIITANYGLGESVVSGESEPDSIRVRCKESNSTDLSIEEISIGQKKVIIDANTLQGGDIAKQYDKSKCCLSDDEILRLARCGLALVGYFQSQRDIEWGFKENQLYLFQSRPVTGLEAYTDFELLHEWDNPSRTEIEFTTRANLGEVMPYALKPLTLTYALRLWPILSARIEAAIKGKNFKYCPECSHDTLIISYHLFLSMRNWTMNMRDSSGHKAHLSKSMEISFFGHEIEDQQDLIEAVKDTSQSIPGALVMQLLKIFSIDLRMAPKRVVMREKKKLAKIKDDVLKLGSTTATPSESRMLTLFNSMKSLPDFGFKPWKNHGLTILLANEYHAALSQALSKYIKDPVKLFTTVAKLLANSSDVVSGEIPQRIAKMAEIIKARGPKEVETFLNMNDSEAIGYLNSSDSLSLLIKSDGDILAEEFNSFIEKFGHRCYNEFDISSLSWANDKAKIVEMIRKNCMFDTISPDNLHADANKKKEPKSESVDDIIESLGLSFVDKILLKYIHVPRCQKFVSIREWTKDIIISFFNIQREASRMLAIEMRRNLRIPDDDLLYYLFYDEIEPLIRQPQPSIVVHAIRRRNIYNKYFKEPWKFDEIIRGHHIVPNHMKPSKELDKALANAPKLHGTPASSGRVQAKVCLVKGYSELDKVRPGDILVTHSTDIAFSPVFPLIAGIITEVGGLISHGAVVAREYGLPSVLGIPDVTRILEDKEEIVLDADNGTIIRLAKSSV